MLTEIKIRIEIRNYFCIRSEIISRSYQITEIRFRNENTFCGRTEITLYSSITCCLAEGY